MATAGVTVRSTTSSAMNSTVSREPGESYAPWTTALTPARSRRTMQDTEQAVRRSAEVLREVDLLPLLDHQCDLMAEHLRIADLPSQRIPSWMRMDST